MRGADHRTTSLARRLRVDQTNAETVLWQRIRNRQINGCKFVRQAPVGRFICDFLCRETRMVIELDGGQHNGSAADAVRDRSLRAQGFRVLRFWNNDVLQNIDGVLAAIAAELSNERLS